MSFYQVVLRGSCFGQEIVNVLWYRESAVIPTLAEFLDYTSAIAAEVKESVWDNAGLPLLGAVSMKNCVSDTYSLDTIEVMAHNEIGTPLSTTPFVLAVGEPGLRPGGTNGPATCIIMNAILEPSFGPGIGLPKRGHLKIGCIDDGMIFSDGKLTSGAIEDFNEFGTRLSANINTESPVGSFFPVRVRTVRVAGVIVSITYRDVQEYVPRARAAYLRSRITEA